MKVGNPEDAYVHHVVRVVNDAVDQLSDAVFEHVYPGGGRPPYHPKLMAKILVYAVDATLVLLSPDCQSRPRADSLSVVNRPPNSGFSDHQPLSGRSDEGHRGRRVYGDPHLAD